MPPVDPNLVELGHTFNWVDLLLILALTATLLVGLGLGFYRQVALATALCAGLFLGGRYTDVLAASQLFTQASKHIGGGGARILAYLTLMAIPGLIALVTFAFFPRVFHRTVRAVDTVLGGFIGSACAVLLFWVTLHGASQLEDNWIERPVRESYLGSRLARGAFMLARVFPADFRTRVEKSIEHSIEPLTRETSPPEGPPAPAPKARAKPDPAAEPPTPMEMNAEPGDPEEPR